MATPGRDLDEQTIRRIVTLRADGKSYREVSRICEVSFQTISRYSPPWLVRLVQDLAKKSDEPVAK